MKTILALSLLVASSAFAKPVAVIKTSGGYTRVPTTTTITLDSNGSVDLETVTTSWEPESKPVVKKVKIAKLNPAIVATILNDVAEANNTKIIDENPDAPKCTDIPSVDFSVVKDGALTVIGRKADCKAFYLDDYQARRAMDLLESIRTLSYGVQ